MNTLNEDIGADGSADTTPTVTKVTVYIDGFGWVDEETGELAEPDETIAAINSDLTADFTDKQVEWVLSKLFTLDGTIVANTARMKAEQEAITKNWRPEISKAQRAKEWFIKWATPMVKAYAERQLAIRNTKKDGTLKANPDKSIKFPQGTLAFRKQPASPEAVAIHPSFSVKEAVEWVQANAPHCIVNVPTIDWEAFTEEDKNKIGTEEDCPLAVLAATEATDVFSIKTGVK